jgi:hypothetical protein
VNKLTKKGPIFLFVSALILVFVGIYLSNVNKPLNSKGECDITSDTCSIPVFDSQLSVKFEQVPQTEEELYLNVDLGRGLSVEQAWIEGVNMYMGKTPVLFEDPTHPSRAVTFLGSCNLTEMQWRLHLKIKKDGSEELSSLSVEFSTFR